MENLSFLAGHAKTSYFTGPEILCDKLNEFVRIEDLYRVLAHAVNNNASDIIFQTGRPVMADIYGKLKALTNFDLNNSDLGRLFFWMTAQNNIIARLQGGEDADSSFEIPDYGNKDEFNEPIRHRFRLNLTAGQYVGASMGYQAVARAIPINPPTLDDIGFPAALIPYATPDMGQVLIAGPTGSGKTTTFAALMRHIIEGNTPIEGNILTWEKPIEYSYNQLVSPCCTVQQHEIGRHIASFAQGVRNSLRRKPALLVIGELRDVETMEAAVEASNTGHPLFSTVHANSVALILKRMMNKFPVDQHMQAFSDLTDTSRLLMSQTLVPRSDREGRICLREWLVLTDEIRERILDAGLVDHVRVIREIMGSDPLHQPMSRSVQAELKAGRIDTATARRVIRRYSAITHEAENELLAG